VETSCSLLLTLGKKQPSHQHPSLHGALPTQTATPTHAPALNISTCSCGQLRCKDSRGWDNPPTHSLTHHLWGLHAHTKRSEGTMGKQLNAGEGTNAAGRHKCLVEFSYQERHVPVETCRVLGEGARWRRETSCFSAGRQTSQYKLARSKFGQNITVRLLAIRTEMLEHYSKTIFGSKTLTALRCDNLNNTRHLDLPTQTLPALTSFPSTLTTGADRHPPVHKQPCTVQVFHAEAQWLATEGTNVGMTNCERPASYIQRETPRDVGLPAFNKLYFFFCCYL